MADISLRKVVKRFRTVTAVDGLSLDIADGEFAVLLGPTGAGKTTTLRIVASLMVRHPASICTYPQAGFTLALQAKRSGERVGARRKAAGRVRGNGRCNAALSV